MIYLLGEWRDEKRKNYKVYRGWMPSLSGVGAGRRVSRQLVGTVGTSERDMRLGSVVDLSAWQEENGKLD